MKTRFRSATEEIRAWILSENFRPGTALPSGQALATSFNLRLGTTFRACQVLISEGLLERKGYKLTLASAKSAPPLTQLIKVLSYSKDFSRSAGRILTERGVNHELLDLSWLRHPSPQPIIMKELGERPGGLILWSGRLDQRTEAFLRTSSVPLVICSAERAEYTGRSTVQIDLFRATQKALRHLYEIGHRRIAHFSPDNEAPAKELAGYYRMVCLDLGLSESASMIWQGDGLNEQLVLDKLLEGRRRHPEVTALFGHDYAGSCATKIFDVPGEISVVGLHGLPEGLECQPPLTTMALSDPEATALWACAELISQIQTIESGRPPKPPNRVFLAPDLVLRKSTRALISIGIVNEISSPSPTTPFDPGATWRKIYPFLEQNGTDNWRQLDLSKLANHSMTRQHGWLGAEPLEYFPPGLRAIHGVPFLVLDEERNRGSSVITFRSPHSHSAGKAELPSKAKIKVNSRVTALYFLHGCGHASRIPFAEYIMYFKSGNPCSVPLIPLGPSRRWKLDEDEDLKPNLQDWWADFEQDDSPHAHHATIFDPAEPAGYERTLYSLEWINPRPEEEVTRIEVRVDPKAGPVLALIAVTALLQAG